MSNIYRIYKSKNCNRNENFFLILVFENVKCLYFLLFCLILATDLNNKYQNTVKFLKVLSVLFRVVVSVL